MFLAEQRTCKKMVLVIDIPKFYVHVLAVNDDVRFFSSLHLFTHFDALEFTTVHVKDPVESCQQSTQCSARLWGKEVRQ